MGELTMEIPNRPRFLIARMSAIGDTILTTAVLCALRDRFPNAFIAWVVEQKSAPVLEGHPCLDELIVVERGWFKSPKKFLALRRRLRALKFDISIDPQSLTKSSLPAWLSGARYRIGNDGKHGGELSRLLNNVLYDSTHPHLVDRSMDLLKRLGIESPQVRFDLGVVSSAEENTDRFLDALNLRPGFAVINPGAGWDSKLWPWERFAQVAAYLLRQHQLRSLVIWAGDREHAWADKIAEASEQAAVVSPKTSLQELISVMRRARMYVGSDTGPMHAAAAVGTRCISLHGPTRPCDSGPYGTNHISLHKEYHVGSRRERRSADNHAMRQIQVEDVCNACEQVLAAQLEPVSSF